MAWYAYHNPVQNDDPEAVFLCSYPIAVGVFVIPA